jgi:hypothetical protein
MNKKVTDVIIEPSNLKNKKYKAILYNNDEKVKTLHFGT